MKKAALSDTSGRSVGSDILSRNELQNFKVIVLPGDGVGPEITAQAVKVLKKIESETSLSFEFSEGLVGGKAIDELGKPIAEDMLEECRHSQAVLLGAVGGPKWDTTDPSKSRPEQGLLALRKELGLFANLRPVKMFLSLAESSTLKPEVVNDIDMIVVRELTGGLYFGKSERVKSDGFIAAYDTMIYKEDEIERIVRLAFQIAKERRKKVTSVDKANVLESSRLWREVTDRVAGDFPDITLNNQLVDNTAMQLIRNPRQFDVLVTENMFGDILSDEAAMLTGSIGMLPSASLGASGVSLFEPIHGSAPDIAGMDVANPLATILSVAMMLRYSVKDRGAASDVERAVEAVLDDGYRTKDIAQPGCKTVGTEEMGDLVTEAIEIG